MSEQKRDGAHGAISSENLIALGQLERQFGLPDMPVYVDLAIQALVESKGGDKDVFASSLSTATISQLLIEGGVEDSDVHRALAALTMGRFLSRRKVEGRGAGGLYSYKAAYKLICKRLLGEPLYLQVLASEYRLTREIAAESPKSPGLVEVGVEENESASPTIKQLTGSDGVSIILAADGSLVFSGPFEVGQFMGEATLRVAPTAENIKSLISSLQRLLA